MTVLLNTLDFLPIKCPRQPKLRNSCKTLFGSKALQKKMISYIFLDEAYKTPQDIFLLLDEVPCCTNNENSGDWSGLKGNEINLMMALKPIGDVSTPTSKQIELHFPADLEHLKLDRVYRCTQTILNFYKKVVERLDTDSNITNFNSDSSTSYNPGHEIYGAPPEILLIPECQLLHKEFIYKTRILAFLYRHQKKLKPMRITVIIDFLNGRKMCIDWLTKELEAKGIADTIDVKVKEECRGMEFPAVITITAYGGRKSARSQIIDAWTRVTSCLGIIHVDDRVYQAFQNGLQDAMKQKVAKRAEEQEMKLKDFEKKYANDPQGKTWFIKDVQKEELYLNQQIQSLELRFQQNQESRNARIDQLKQELADVQKVIINTTSDLPPVLDDKEKTKTCPACSCNIF